MAKKPTPSKSLFIRNPDVILREEETDGALLFNPDTNQIRVLNATGLFIWKQCDGKSDLPAIIAAMKEAFDGVPEAEIETEINDFLNDMKTNGFLGLSEVKKKET
jgi:hypothetical protein